MTLHEAAEAARRKVYDDAIAGLQQSATDAAFALDQARAALADEQAVVESLRRALAVVSTDRDAAQQVIVERDALIAELRARIAELEAGQPPTRRRCLVGVYNGTEMGADDPFFNALGPALGSATSYYTTSAKVWLPAEKRSEFRLREWDVQRIQRGILPVIHFQSMQPKQTQTHAWADVAAGLHDADFIQWAHALKDTPAGTSFSFDAEPEVRIEQGSHQQLPDNGKNTPEHYAAALRRIHDVMHPIAPNVDYRFWFAGHRRDAYMERFYPGDAYVDSITFDPYVWKHDHKVQRINGVDVKIPAHPREKYQPIVDWLRSRSWGKGKPIGITETGIDKDVYTDDDIATFWSRIPAVVDELGLEVFVFYNRSNWQITATSHPKAWAAYLAAMRQIAS